LIRIAGVAPTCKLLTIPFIKSCRWTTSPIHTKQSIRARALTGPCTRSDRRPTIRTNRNFAATPSAKTIFCDRTLIGSRASPRKRRIIWTLGTCNRWAAPAQHASHSCGASPSWGAGLCGKGTISASRFRTTTDPIYTIIGCIWTRIRWGLADPSRLPTIRTSCWSSATASSNTLLIGQARGLSVTWGYGRGSIRTPGHLEIK